MAANLLAFRLEGQAAPALGRRRQTAAITTSDGATHRRCVVRLAHTALTQGSQGSIAAPGLGATKVAPPTCGSMAARQLVVAKQTTSCCRRHATKPHDGGSTCGRP